MHLATRWGLCLFRCAVLAIALVATAADAVVLDITSQFAITRTGLVLNRTSNTFDSTITLKNTSGAPVLGPIAVVVGGLPSGVTLANATGLTTPDGQPYLSPLAAGTLLGDGGAVSFVAKFNNPNRVTFTGTLQVRYTVDVPANAPTLISSLSTGGTNAYLVGRVDGAPSRPISVQVSAAPACVAGTLVNGATVGGPLAATTDSDGYFAVNVSGVNLGAFVTLKMVTPAASPPSLCQVNTREQNDSWPRAFLVDGSPAGATDFIDSPGKARWYKFSIIPGQRIDVVLSGLPADYDLVVFKDIGKAFLSQFNPATAGATDLLKLTAEYAPSAFSPSAFSPSAFSPDAYSPSAFSPSAFSPSAFSPSAFSPSAFSPSAFSPTTFAPSAFSPSAFSPSAFSPSAFSPSVFTDAEIKQAFSTAQTRSIIAVSAMPGNGNESATVNTWNNTGFFYVRVTGRNGAFNTSTPFAVNVTKGVTTCVGVTDTAITSRSLLTASGLKTVILTDSSKVALDDELPGPTQDTLRTKLTAFAARSEVNGVIVDVTSFSRVGVLKQQAANNPACPFAKNLVAEEIKGIVDTYRANPLRYVVIVGNDDVIPFFRSPDQSGLGQESAFVPPVSSNSPSEASLRNDFVLSQDGYGAKTRLAMTASDFPVPGLAVGRLIETPTEMAGMIDAYVQANGVVVPSSSLVTGYDFLVDAANAVGTELQAGTNVAPDRLVATKNNDGVTPASPQDPASWNATQLRSKLLDSRHDVIFLAGHFSAGSALAADFTTSVLTTDLAASSLDLTNSIVFSAGCHSGYNLVDTDAILGVTQPLDWSQAFARKRATLIAGTGYQYGDTDFLEYSERLYRNFARQLRAGTGQVAIGEALVRAKLDYLATTPDIRGIHEKTLLEATLFGLPMLAVNMPAGRGALPSTAGVIAPTPVAAGPAAALGLSTFELPVAPSLSPQSVMLKNVLGGPDIGANWLNGSDGVTSKPGEPVLPLMAVNVTPLNSNIILRGVGLRSGTYVDSAPLLPFSGAPTTELRNVHVPFVSPVFYPGRIFNPNYFGAIAGSGGTQLLVTPAQHRVADVVAGTSTQRKFTGLGLRLFYSGNLTQAALSEAPAIAGVDAQTDASGTLFTVQATGDPKASIYQVWVTYTGAGSGTFTSLDLSQCVAPLPAACASEDSRLWKGRLPNAPANLKYFVQAVNGVGLVALDDRLGAYYGVGTAAPLATTVALVTPPANATIGSSVDITAKLAYAGGTPIVGKLVTFALAGVSQTGITGADGSVTVKVPTSAVSGTYQATVSYLGDDGVLASSSSSVLIVGKATTSLAGLPANVAPAGVTLTGNLGAKTEPIPQVSVSFAVTGPGGPTISAITDYLGQAKLPPAGLPGGTYTVTSATFDGNSTYAGTTVALLQQFVVPKIPQTLAFGAVAANASYGTPVSLSAVASSGLPVSFATTGPCSVSRFQVQTNGLGTCTITASQGGDAVYAAATSQQRTFNITQASQLITFAPAPVGVTVGQALLTVSATSSSPASPPTTSPITMSSLTPGICSVAGTNGGSLTPLAVGTCIVAANQAGDSLYTAPSQATLNIPIAAAGSPPTTFTVTNLNDSGAGSLRSAITSANAAAGPNFIGFAPGLTGTIVLTSGQIPITGPTQITGPGAGVLAINGNANNRVFVISTPTSPACPAADPSPDYLVSISGLRLTNAHRNVAGSTGGAIYTEHSLALDSMVIDNNAARGGAGVQFSIQYPGQTLSISNSHILDNLATELLPPPLSDTFPVAGAGLYVVERCSNVDPFDVPYTKPVTVTIANSEFRGNVAQPLTTHDGRGGGMRSYSLADITITDTVFVDNHVDAPNPPPPANVYRGGGIDIVAKSLRIERSEISENTVFDPTGSDLTRSGGLHLVNSSIDRQGPGDAMAVKIIDSTISGNVVSATGGAMIASGNVALSLYNSTVSDNLAPPTRTGGINMSATTTYPLSAGNTVRPTLRLVSTIAANNSSDGGDLSINSNVIPFTTLATNSLIEKISASPTSTSLVSGTANLIGVDPLLGPLASNGGTTRTHALLPGSPAIDAGSNPLGLTTDQRLVARLSGAAVDIGAYESGAAPPGGHAYLSQFGSSGPTNGQFSSPFGVAIDPTSHNILVADFGNQRVQIFDSSGTYLSQFGTAGSGNGQFAGPTGIAIDPTSHNIVVSDFGNQRVQIFSAAGVYLSQFGSSGTGPGQFNHPIGVAIHPISHNIFVIDNANQRMQLFNSTGVFQGQVGSLGSGNGQFNSPDGVVVDPISLDVLVTDTGNSRVQRFTSAGVYLTQFGTAGSGNGQFIAPMAIAVDPTSGNIVVSDYSLNRVEILNPSGTYVSQFGASGTGNGQFSFPWGVAIDPTSHNIVVVDFGNNRVQIFGP